VPYHITHRGNRRQSVFLERGDRLTYKKWLNEYSASCGLAIWAYCLMPNHVHLLVVPETAHSLALTIGRTHGRFAQRQNRRYRWSGHLWANRYYSAPLDEEHAWAAVRYIELNPVRAGLVERAESYEWSSARSHALGRIDDLLSPNGPFPGHVRSWSEWLASAVNQEKLDLLRECTRTGRPAGSPSFVAQLENRLERVLRASRVGRPGKQRN
jgi:putative transposase